MIFHDLPLELGVAIQGSWGHHFPGSSHPRFLQLMSFREGFKELKRPTKFAEIRSNKRVSTSRCLPGLKYQQIPGTGRSSNDPEIASHTSTFAYAPKKTALLDWARCRTRRCPGSLLWNIGT